MCEWVCDNKMVKEGYTLVVGERFRENGRRRKQKCTSLLFVPILMTAKILIKHTTEKRNVKSIKGEIGYNLMFYSPSSPRNRYVTQFIFVDEGEADMSRFRSITLNAVVMEGGELKATIGGEYVFVFDKETLEF